MAEVRSEWRLNPRGALLRPSVKPPERSPVAMLDHEAKDEDSEGHDRSQKAEPCNRFEEQANGVGDD